MTKSPSHQATSWFTWILSKEGQECSDGGFENILYYAFNSGYQACEKHLETSVDLADCKAVKKRGRKVSKKLKARK